MTLDQLLKFIKKEDQRLIKRFPLKDEQQRKYLIALKVMEEAGELAEAVLSSDGIQRKEKLLLYKHKDLGDELADVLITTLILAENQKINIKKYLQIAIDKRLKRRY